MRKRIRQIFIAGLAVTVPVVLTLYVLFFLIGLMDNLLRVLPRSYHPDTLLGFHVPGLGVIASFLFIILMGLLVRSYVGRRIVNFGEAVFHRIPVIRSVYEGTKQVVDNMIVNKARSFKRVVLVEFPSPGKYAVGLVTGPSRPLIEGLVGRPCLNVFVPTTPNPTSGYLICVPEDQVKELDMTVEEAFTFIISCGIVENPARLDEDLRRIIV
ncbi:MAG TPA: DUF502 domain-containing protein [Syntrophales bacterium]|nr:DUF502 domain-containing protein [Syntrophales bacterium]HOM07655.1 DUF502 domain-containing protein [Syntrophales bacterium]HOO00308.1 DUF502 domain-containing protein [Syntrophales bacterium]HPC01204.1 DUF502 domain-containing protein [Syntrophales bacterium]HPQ07203.1 DUF502 domain-containing protein [Syntrophales bacterium]